MQVCESAEDSVDSYKGVPPERTAVGDLAESLHVKPAVSIGRVASITAK